MDFSKITNIRIKEGNVTKITDKDNKIVWQNIIDPEQYAYGVRFSNKVSTNPLSPLERIGNIELHKTLPIQSKFACCIHQGENIQYWCHPNDSRFRKDTTGYKFGDLGLSLSKRPTDSQPSDYSPSKYYDAAITINTNIQNNNPELKLLVTTFKYKYAYIKINDTIVCRVNFIDFSTDTIKLELISGTLSNDSKITSLELGCSINGYDGEIGVYIPKFYLWSIDNNGTNDEVWMSEKKCVPYAREVKPHIIGIGRCCYLNKVFNDKRWGWINTLKQSTALNVINYNPKLRGILLGVVPTNAIKRIPPQVDTSGKRDEFLGTNNFRTNLGKPIRGIAISDLRESLKVIPKSRLLYYQIWTAICWCYIIEYANFDIEAQYMTTTDSNGCKWGGLRSNISAINMADTIYGGAPIVPNDFTLELGNGIGIKTKPQGYYINHQNYASSWEDWNLNDVEATKDGSTITITKVNAANAYIDCSDYVVGGDYTYRITGLTDNQVITLNGEKSNNVIGSDGEYKIDWGINGNRKKITISNIQDTCNIKIDIVSPISANVTAVENEIKVPHYRGFNGFWHGDGWLYIDNYTSLYGVNQTSSDINNFDTNDINLIDKFNSSLSGWGKTMKLNKEAYAEFIEAGDSNEYTYSWFEIPYYNMRYNFSVGGDWKSTTKAGLLSRQVIQDITELTYVKCIVLDDKAE